MKLIEWLLSLFTKSDVAQSAPVPVVIEDAEKALLELTRSISPSQVVTWAINLYLDRVGESVDRLAALEMAQRILQSALAAIELEASEERNRLDLLKD